MIKKGNFMGENHHARYFKDCIYLVLPYLLFFDLQCIRKWALSRSNCWLISVIEITSAQIHAQAVSTL